MSGMTPEKKTTVRFHETTHVHPPQMAEARGSGASPVGREAYSEPCPIGSTHAAAEALRRLAALALPVTDVSTMKRESVPWLSLD